MFRNQYDSDVTVWSPQGRLHQVEYAMEAVKLGSATVGLKSKTHAVLIALKRASSELSAHQKKIIPIDTNIGITIAGLTADARILSRYMRTECLNHKYSHDALLPVSRLISSLGNKMQVCTQRYDRRPYGVGLLVAGYDDQGPHVYQTCPSANYFDCKAMAVGSRSQSARTYLEKHLEEFPDCDTDELIKHGLRALRDTLPNEVELTTKEIDHHVTFILTDSMKESLSWEKKLLSQNQKGSTAIVYLENVSIGIVGKNTPFKALDEEGTAEYLRLIEGEEKRGGPPDTTGQDPTPPQPPPSGDGPQDPIPAVAMETE